MKNFLNQLLEGSRVGLLCGNLNDLFLPPDLVERDIEQYLQVLLREQGIKHIIFYGSDGGRGAFCLDEESASYFFSPAATPAAQAPSSGRMQSAGGAAADLVRRHSAPAAGNDASAAAPAPAQPQGQIYSRRSWGLVEFASSMKNRLLNDPDSIAVVFYDILNTPLGESPMLINELLGTFQRKNSRNVCLMLAPGTEGSKSNLIRLLDSYRISGHFTVDTEPACMLNPLTTFRIGPPDEDEILHLLYRQCMGIGRTRPLRLGEPIEQLAQELLYNSRQQKNPSLRRIKWMLERDSSDQPLTRDRIDQLMGMPCADRVPALEKINRPGWETVYEKMKKLYKSLRKQQEDLRASWSDQTGTSMTGMDIRRMSVSCVSDVPRVPVPSLTLLGKPGTGKTTLVPLIGQVFKEAGVLRIGHVHMVGQDKLVSSLVGGVQQNVLAACDAAEEGLLVIDDAQSLSKIKDGGVNSNGTALQIVETLVRAMTDPSRHLCVVLSGYPDEVREVFKMDDGLERRFGGLEITIPDYPPQVLKKVLLNHIQQRDYTIDPELTQSDQDGLCPLDHFLEKIYMTRNRRTFGNADAMIKLGDEVCNLAEPDRMVRKAQFCLHGRDASWFESPSAMCSLKAVLDEMEKDVVGMQRAKEQLFNRALQIQERQDKGQSTTELFTKAIVLEGNPGTGKTTLANMMGRQYFGLGLAGTEVPIIHSASELNSSAAGGNSAQILEWINEAVDKKAILVVDEAHQMIELDRVAAFRALMAPLTDQKRPFQLVLAGYPGAMESLIAQDPGGDRRFLRIRIDDYTAQEMLQILSKMMSKGGCQADPQAIPLLEQVCYAYEQAHKQDFRIGNGGGMEQLLDALNQARRRRLWTAGIHFASPEAGIIMPQDVQAAKASLPSLVQQALGLAG